MRASSRLSFVYLLAAACSTSHATGDAGPTPDGGGGSDGGGGGDYYACEYVGDCSLVSTMCCATCGIPTLADVAAVNSEQAMAYYREVACPEWMEVPACLPCKPGSNPALFSTCAAGRCEARDVTADATLTGCTADAECVIRVPDCCECGADTSPQNLIALRLDALGAYTSLVCDPRADCATCAPVYPDTVAAFCEAGVCTARIAMGM
jgi:hypothetical protein